MPCCAPGRRKAKICPVHMAKTRNDDFEIMRLTALPPYLISGPLTTGWLCFGTIVQAGAGWQSGYAEDCKSSDIGSIPVSASKSRRLKEMGSPVKRVCATISTLL